MMHEDIWSYLSSLGYVNSKETRNCFDLLHEIVVRLLNSENYGLLITLCRDILEFDPHIELVEKVLFTLINLKEDKHVIEICEKYLELKPNHKIVFAVMKEFARYSNYSSALDTCQLYLEYNHEDKSGFVRKVIFRFLKNGREFEEIFDLIKNYSRLNPLSDFVYNLIYLIIETQNYPLAVKISELILDFDSINIQKLFKIIILLNDNGQSRGALRICNKLIRKFAKSPDLLLICGYSLKSEGRFQRALEVFKEALNLVRSSDFKMKGKIWCYIGWTYIGQQEYTKAVKASIKAVKLNPDFIEIYCNLGYLYYKKGYREKGISLIEKTIAKNPRFCHAWVYLGEIYYMEKNYHSAFRACFNCLSINNQFREGVSLYKKLAKDPTVILLNWILMKFIKLGYRRYFEQVEDDTIPLKLMKKYNCVVYSKEFKSFLKELDFSLFDDIIAIYSWIPRCTHCRNSLKQYGERSNYKTGVKTYFYRCDRCGLETEEDRPLDEKNSYLKVRVIFNSSAIIAKRKELKFDYSKLEHERIFLTFSDFKTFQQGSEDKIQQAVLLYGKDLR